MQRCCRPLLQTLGRRAQSTATPWFVDPPSELEASRSIPLPKPNHVVIPPLPENTPSTLRELHAHLAQSPHLDLTTLSVSQPLGLPPGRPLPLRLPHGRRKRGGTYSGESVYDVPGGIWNWVVMAQVKEGTENKGAIESVVRVIRKTVCEFVMKRNDNLLITLVTSF
jgi:hypothetical protein